MLAADISRRIEACLQWVKSGTQGNQQRCLLCLAARTSSARPSMSVKCYKQTKARC
jgi:hypothetical protein